MKFLRANLWWNAIVPQTLAWVYFSMLMAVPVNSVNQAVGNGLNSIINPFIFLPYFATLILVSTFGYLFNDFCDVESDARAGKRNVFAKAHTTLAFLSVTGVLCLGGTVWFFMLNHFNYPVQLWPATALLGLQIFLLVLYSAKPFRLKERGIWGVIADALYGHLNPALITLFTFNTHLFFRASGWLGASVLEFLLVVSLLWFVKGIRNILLHQLEDRRSDRKAQVHTYVTEHSALAIVNFLNRILIPVELALLTIFVLFVSAITYPPFFLSLFFFAIISYFKFSGWKLAYLPKRQLKFKFLHFLNDYYEGWFPVFLLIIASVYYRPAILVLIIHLILFPSFIIQLWKDVSTIRENFKTEEDY
jgi:hypothetical protein